MKSIYEEQRKGKINLSTTQLFYVSWLDLIKIERD